MERIAFADERTKTGSSMRQFKRFTTAIALAVTLLSVLPAEAETMTPQASLEALMTPNGLTADRFDARFLAQVSFAEVEGLVASLIAKHGALQRIDRARRRLHAALHQGEPSGHDHT
jgi:hypothetical protein